MKRAPQTKSLIFFCILLIRLAPLLLISLQGERQPIASGDADPLLYWGGARSIVSTGVNPFNFFPPLNFIFIATFLYVGGGSILVPMGAVAVVGWLMVIGVYLLAKELFGERTALITTVLAGVYPSFIFYGISFYSETLALFFIVISFLMVVRYFHTWRYYYLLMGGVLWGLASQTRGGIHIFSVVMLTLMIMAHLSKGMKVPWGSLATFVVSTYLTILTVGIVVLPTQGEFSLNAKSGIGSFIHGANRITTSCPDYGDIRGNIFYAINSCKEKWPDHSQLYSEDIWKLSTGQIVQAVFSFIAEDPLTYLTNSLKKLSCLWSPNQAPIYYIKTKFPQVNSLLIGMICGGICLFTIAVIAGGVCGIAISKESFRPVFIVFILFYCVMVFFTVGNSKLRLPLMPFFIIYCASFCSQVAAGMHSWKRVVFHRWSIMVLLLFIGNSIYKYQEIALTPGEVRVRQIELCDELGFPHTAGYLIRRYTPYHHYTHNQTDRMRFVEKNVLRKLNTLEKRY